VNPRNESTGSRIGPESPELEPTVTIPPKKKTMKLTDFSSCAG
jgi:hypothetical protein